LFIAWTIKGYGLPFAGHKDNHAGLMNPTQLAALREAMGVREGQEWEPLEGVGDNARGAVDALLDRSRVAREKRSRSFGKVSVPAIPAPAGDEQSTQAAFGRILLDLSKAGGDLAERILTTSPDVTVSTNLGAWVNQRGLFRRSEIADVFAKEKIASAQKWSATNKGQHIELGIAESNLFLMLAAAGLSGDLFGERLFPIGTLYDPFIARGLDSLNYACYQDARFLLVATPSGITLGPEGGAHQSINPPLIALGQPGIRHYEPAYADELAAMMEEAFRLIDDPAGESSYLRLSTRSIDQVERSGDSWRDGAIKGAYWLREAAPDAEAAIVAMGAVMPEALAAWEELRDDIPGLGLLSITSPDLLHRGWTAAQAGRWQGERNPSHIEQLLSRLSPRAGLVTIADAAPASLSWLGGVLGQRVAPLGVEKFGQTGSLAELYATYRLDGDAITEAVAELLLPA
jgi:pyruvate dehydrogenase E1 component